MRYAPDTTSDGSSDESELAKHRTTRQRRRPKENRSSQVVANVESSRKSTKLREQLSDVFNKRLHSVMKLVEKQLETKVVEEDPELMQIYVALGKSASSAIKNAPGFKSLRTALIKEFVQIKWSKIGIFLTIVYLTADDAAVYGVAFGSLGCFPC
ncbi:uncharacterized protein [Physcomitrium patens]|uniref:uncharacterized protein isoform X3 n=1 Tax=Physcomitrium patens TaxID=3218 RepID=UPI003CCD6B23